MLTDTVSQNQVLKQDANGLLQFYDVSRSRWLSVTRHNIYFGLDHKNISDDLGQLDEVQRAPPSRHSTCESGHTSTLISPGNYT